MFHYSERISKSIVLLDIRGKNQNIINVFRAELDKIQDSKNVAYVYFL